MKSPEFVDGRDTTTFQPFVLIDCRDSEWSDVRLSFSAWDWLHESLGSDTIDDYYLNGYGVQGLVLAARLNAGLEPLADGMEPDSEGDTCFLHFADLETAVETARLAHAMIHDRATLATLIPIAEEHELEDL